MPLASLIATALLAEAPLTKIGLGSCLNQTMPAPILRVINKAKPQVFVWMGDNIYGDPEKGKAWEPEYEKQLQQPGMKELLKTPSLAIWDDGDSGLNDGGEEDPYKADARKAFVNFWKPTWLADPAGKGLYGSVTKGPEGKRVQFIILDTRSFRSPLKPKAADDQTPGRYDPEPDPSKTMLGAAQWKWLEGELREPAEVRIVVSSIQVIPEDHKWEKWGNLPAERTKLYNMIRDTKANGVIFVSGDRHLAEISMMDGGVGYPLYDVTASSMNASRVDWRGFEPNRNRVSTMNVGHNFGMILIDWKAADPLIRLQVRDELGEVALQQKVPLNWLKAGKIK